MKLDRTVITRCGNEKADAQSGWQGWIGRTGNERLAALESLRSLRIPLNQDGTLTRLQRVFTIVKRGERTASNRPKDQNDLLHLPEE